MKNPKVWGVIIAVVALGGLIKYLWPDPKRIGPSVVPEPIMLLGPFVVSNSILVSWIVMLLLFLFAFMATRKLSLVPSGAQNVMEMVVEAIMNLVRQTTGGNEKLVRWFFPFVMTFLLYILVGNFLGLVPGFGPIGVVHHEDPKHPEPLAGVVELFPLPSFFHVPGELHVPPKVEAKKEETKSDAAKAEEHHSEFFPFFRAPAADFNMTLAIALISWIMTQSYGIINLGLPKFLSKYIVLGKLLKGNIGMGLLDFVVGILETISEFSKVISLSFRLFGNIFAGEVLLLIMFVLFPVLPLPFYFLEIMVAGIQAFVFAILTLVFMTQATNAPHGDHDDHGHGHEAAAAH